MFMKIDSKDNYNVKTIQWISLLCHVWIWHYIFVPICQQRNQLSRLSWNTRSWDAIRYSWTGRHPATMADIPSPTTSSSPRKRPTTSARIGARSKPSRRPAPATSCPTWSLVADTASESSPRIPLDSAALLTLMNRSAPRALLVSYHTYRGT